MKVFLAVASLRAAYGGPSISVPRLAESLAELGLDVGLWAADGSATETGTPTSNHAVSCLDGSPVEAIRRFGRPDILHDNGIWLRHNHSLAVLARQAGVPRIVSPRGMLEPWAMAHKRTKKTIAWHLYQRRDLQHASLLHASSELESGHLYKLGLAPLIAMIPFGVDAPPEELVERAWSARANSEEARQRTGVFLGRLYPVKGLPMLLRAWAALRPPGWNLVLAGPDEDGHRAELERLIAEENLGNTVSLPGPVTGDIKTRLLLEADLFILPSHQESFGLAAAEALAHGLPVLTTTATPWTRLVEHACGWLAEPTVGSLEQMLHQATALDSATLVEYGRRGRAMVTTRYSWAASAAQFRDIYAGFC